MGCSIGYLFIFESGAGGYLWCSDKAEACDRASYFEGSGWIFHFAAVGYASGWHRRSRPVIKLRHVSTLGSPNATAMQAALTAAGTRHGVEYKLDCE